MYNERPSESAFSQTGLTVKTQINAHGRLQTLSVLTLLSRLASLIGRLRYVTHC